MGQLAQVAIERLEPRCEVVEATVDKGPDLRVHPRHDTSPRRADVLRQRGDVLQRAVVEIEPEAQGSFLGRVDERPLTRVRPLEEHVSLEDRGDRHRSLVEITVNGVAIVEPPAGDHRTPRNAPTENRNTHDRLLSDAFAAPAVHETPRNPSHRPRGTTEMRNALDSAC